MAMKSVAGTERDMTLSLEILERLIGSEGARDVGVRLWDGRPWPDEAPRRATLVLNHAGALRSMFVGGDERSLAEAYLYDDFDIEGDIEAVFGLADRLSRSTDSWRAKLPVADLLLRLPGLCRMPRTGRGPARLQGRKHSEERDRKAISYHYDVSNDFYALFLGASMNYSCAYFQSPDDDLDAAQARKLDLLCRKLRLAPGQRLLDIGCGWGALVLAAARRGADATGVTLGEPQAILGQERIRAEGLGDGARIRIQDYRRIPEDGVPYDALASVGMVEHVGRENLPLYFRKAYRLLRPGGVFLNHGIACPVNEAPPPKADFSSAYVFPDGELVPIGELISVAEQAGFEVRDVESLREHYKLTLRQWVRRLEARHDEALSFVDELTYRVWRLYMAASAHAFDKGSRSVYQVLLSKPDDQGRSGLPLTRDDWYRT